MKRYCCLAAFALSASSAFAQLSHDATAAGAPGRVFAPPGNLYDNDVSNFTTSLASQDSAGTFTFVARTADDFVLDGTGCASGTFNLSQVRIQAVQADAAPQAFGVEIYADDGTGASPSPANAISPIATLAQSSQTNLGPFGVGTSLFEASFGATGTQLAAATTYWISGFGTNGGLNTTGFNNFLAASNGAPATTPNGMIIAPNFGVPNWTPVQLVIGGAPLAFSFAIDGTCAAAPVPTLNMTATVALALLLAGVAASTLRKMRSA